jgi:enoyl-CoA hydratase
MMSDITLMAEDAYLFSGQLKMGVAAGDHSVLLWPLSASLAKVKLHLLTGEPMDGPTAARLGLVSRCVPGEALLAEAEAVARKLADGPQNAQAWTKRALGNWIRRSIAHLDYSLALQTLGFQSADAREGVEALGAKRPPDFPSARQHNP